MSRLRRRLGGLPVLLVVVGLACSRSEGGGPGEAAASRPTLLDGAVAGAALGDGPTERSGQAGGFPAEAGQAPPGASFAVTAPSRADSLVLLAGGDVNLGREAGQAILRDPSYDPLGDVAPLLAGADLRFVNLESQLSDQGGETQSPTQRLKFTGPPGGAAVLAAARIDVVSVANNHMWDYGRRAFLETLQNLEASGVAYAGASAVPGRQFEPAVLRVKGWSVAIFAVTHIWNHGALDQHPAREHVAGADFGRLRPLLAAARQEHDVVLVSYHGGGEYVELPMTWTVEFARAVMNAGADAFLGHHPHVPQGVGFAGDRPILYSLGNLVFAMHSDHPWTGISFFARLTFTRAAAPRLEACPYHILGHRPQPFEGKSKAARERQLRRHLARISLGFGGVELGEPTEHSCFEVRPRRRTR